MRFVACATNDFVSQSDQETAQKNAAYILNRTLLYFLPLSLTLSLTSLSVRTGKVQSTEIYCLQKRQVSRSVIAVSAVHNKKFFNTSQQQTLSANFAMTV